MWGVECLWLIESDDHDWDHQSMRLTEGCRYTRVGRHIILHVVAIISTYLCSNKIHLAFPLMITWIAQEICAQGDNLHGGQ